jgi:hypothetical protein
MRHRGFPESTGTGKQDMTHMSFPFFSAVDSRFDDSFDMLLSDEFVERVRSSGVADVQKLVSIYFFHFH